MRNKDIADDFLNGYPEGKGSHLIIGKVTLNGKQYLALLSYGYYPIGIVTAFGVFVRVDKYSQTTAKHIGYLLRGLAEKNYTRDRESYHLPIDRNRPDFYLYRNNEILCVKCSKRLNNLTDNCQPFDNCSQG